MKNKTYENGGLASFSLYNIAFTVSSIEQSIKWYQDVFGFKLISRTTFTIPAGSAEVAFIEHGGLRLELLEVPDSKRIDALFAEAPHHLNVIGNKTIVLQVEDVAAATRELEEKGVTFVWREQYLVGDQMLCTMIQDVDGNKINIFQTNTIIEDKKK
ncbi:VOC family protein [Flavobacterium sp.]|uniref:VOC family protein n=1 Tax=Flavobacterium sp. TaxID=239 RepID=UPI002B4B8927|nr:VOC family protein [Flavobacterium sp.]HLF52638.1 VOC family protein [Flavobacterium sp.]